MPSVREQHIYGAVTRLKRMGAEQRGENIAEYGLILSFVSLGVVGAAIAMGVSFEAMWQGLYNVLTSLLDLLP